MLRFLLLITFLLSIKKVAHSQNENNVWYFGYSAGLNFNTNPPTVLTNGRTHVPEGGSSVADVSGNLLFYTSGDTVWNKSHQIMSNGTGLFGFWSSTQNALIVKQPGNANIYFIFTTEGGALPKHGLCYSIVDISLAGGLGAVTTKNVLVYSPTEEKLAGTPHCNGQDVWIITHEHNSTNFKAYLLTAAGVSSTPVISSFGPTILYNPGQLKISSNGKKLAVATTFSGTTNSQIVLFDFDNATGIISNSLSLTQANTLYKYGLEFSADGSKLYSNDCAYGAAGAKKMVQWDLCAGSNTAIVNSLQVVYTVSATNPSQAFGAFQLATDGKIYVARSTSVSTTQQTIKKIGVINNPNLNGPGCNYVDTVISLAPGFAVLSLPNMIFKGPPFAQFTFTRDPISCTTISLTGPSIQSPSVTCSALGYSLTGLLWNFGDTASGTSNTSTLDNPVHIFSTSGSYTVQLSWLYSNSCGSYTRNQSQVISLPTPPSISVSNRTICEKEVVKLIASGATSYTWSTGANSSSITISPTITTVYTVTWLTAPNPCPGTKTVAVTVSKCTGIEAIDQYDLNSMVIFPNPTSDDLHLSFSSDIPLGIKLFSVSNTLGQIVVEGKFVDNSADIRTDELGPGLYQIRIQTDVGVISKKFFKTE